jgi:pilus assembly protein CpaF
MALRERLIRESNGNGLPVLDEPAGGQQGYQEMKARLHRTLINRMDLTKLGQLDPEKLHAEVARLAESVLAQDETPLSSAERERLIYEVRHELFGLGPLELLLADTSISDILVNSPTNVYIERGGKLERSHIAFKDDEHLMRVIERIVSSVGRRIDESSPMVDARLKDGSRVNAIIPPLALDGPTLSIRRFGTDPLRMHMLIEKGALTQDMASMHRRRQDDAAERAVGLHPRGRAHHHD